MLTDMQIPIIPVSDGTTQRLIANIQENTVANKDYYTGEQFILNGVLYRVTKVASTVGSPAIAQGATIDIANDCEVSDTITQQIVNITEQIAKTDWTDCKASGVSGTVYCKRVGDIVSLHINITAGMTTTYTQIGTLPADMIPSTTKYLMGVAAGGTNEVSTIQIQGTTGKVSVVNSSSGTKCFAEPMFML